MQKIIFQYWNPIAHLMEIKLGDGVRADHPPDAINEFVKSKKNSSLVSKSVRRILNISTKLLSLKGRDLTIYAKKKVDL